MTSSERVITSLCVRVRAAELSDESSRVSLGVARTGLAEMRRQVRDTVEQLQQCRIARMYDKERIERIEAYLRRYMGDMHSTFHASNLKKRSFDKTLIIPLDAIQTDDKLHFIEEPVEIKDQDVERLKQSRIPIINLVEFQARS
ncbi:hypothetical protein Tco_0188745 [Tanacetum coccineum]